MNTEQQITELDNSVKELQGLVDLGKSLERLRKNRDFKKIIESEYMREEAVRLVHLKGNSNVQEPRQQASIDNQIMAIGCLSDFLDMVEARAAGAVDAIDECEDLRAELEEESE